MIVEVMDKIDWALCSDALTETIDTIFFSRMGPSAVDHSFHDMIVESLLEWKMHKQTLKLSQDYFVVEIAFFTNIDSRTSRIF